MQVVGSVKEAGLWTSFGRCVFSLWSRCGHDHRRRISGGWGLINRSRCRCGVCLILSFSFLSLFCSVYLSLCLCVCLFVCLFVCLWFRRSVSLCFCSLARRYVSDAARLAHRGFFVGGGATAGTLGADFHGPPRAALVLLSRDWCRWWPKRVVMDAIQARARRRHEARASFSWQPRSAAQRPPRALGNTRTRTERRPSGTRRAPERRGWRASVAREQAARAAVCP